jgi:hypothetical protein
VEIRWAPRLRAHPASHLVTDLSITRWRPTRSLRKGPDPAILACQTSRSLPERASNLLARRAAPQAPEALGAMSVVAPAPRERLRRALHLRKGNRIPKASARNASQALLHRSIRIRRASTLFADHRDGGRGSCVARLGGVAVTRLAWASSGCVCADATRLHSKRSATCVEWRPLSGGFPSRIP